MKNITHYFSDPIKCETTSNDSGEVTKKSPCATDQQKSVNNPVKKRSRVKIKISRKDSTDRECQIIESKNDEVDKTPSPFTKVRAEQQVQQCDTPKTVYSTKTTQSVYNEERIPEAVEILKEIKSKNGEEVVESKNSNNEPMSNKQSAVKSQPVALLSNEITPKLQSPSNIGNVESLTSGLDSEESDILIIEDTDGRKEANAFQVLMTRSKPIQYVSQEQTADEDVEASSRKTEIKEKLRSHKEKLTVLANRKGFAKRKLAEIEEAEQIENNIQNRVKAFKSHFKKDNCDEVTVNNHNNSPSSLFNYFSKTSVELSQKDTVAMSTIIVKADVHVGEESDTVSPLNNTFRKVQCKKPLKLNSYTPDPHEDDIQIVASEHLPPLSDDDTAKEKQSKMKQSKPKWSLRIKLNEGDIPNGDDSNDRSPENKGTGGKKKRESERIAVLSKENTVKHNKNGYGINDTSINKEPKKDKSGQTEKRQKTETNTDKDVNDIKILDKDTKHDNTKAKGQLLTSLLCGSGEQVIENCKVVEDVSLKRKSTDKLAPLFTKKYKTDPAVLAARRLFLQSDVTPNSNSNKSMEKKPAANSILSQPFPLISHVTQLSEQSILEDVNYNYKIRLKLVNKYVPSLNECDYKIISDFTSKAEASLNVNDKKLDKDNIEEVLTEVENQYPEARQLWKNISSITKGTPSTSPKNNRSRKSRHSDKKPLSSEQNGDKHLASVNLWCCKYKPRSTAEVVGNEEAASKLRDWLSKWRSTVVKEDDSSGDEFYSSDCSMSSIMGNNQVAVLLGPYGSGKTASVYAVAEELGYSVLEVNASSKRHGKKILKDFEEATKSHRVKKDNIQFSFAPIKKSDTSKKIPQNSLILFEDVDIIFEEDEGFVSAVYQLASNTKRPIVMTCRDVCSHLNKLAPEQNRIYFQSVCGNRAIALLQLISLAEIGSKIPRSCLADLLQTGDLRRALLQLQFLLLPGLSISPQKSVILRESLWRDMRHYLYKPAIKTKKQKKKKHKASTALQAEDNQDELKCLVDDVDRISLIASLVDVEDEAVNLTHGKLQPSLSLTENTMPYHSSTDLSTEIAEWLGYNTMYKKHVLNSVDGSTQDSTLIKKQLNTGVDFALSQITPASLDRSALSVDYLPFVRTICRIEESRAAGNYKRGNRFFHYLHGLKLPATSTKPNILAAACKMMQDRDENVEKK